MIATPWPHARGCHSDNTLADADQKGFSSLGQVQGVAHLASRTPKERFALVAPGTLSDG